MVLVCRCVETEKTEEIITMTLSTNNKKWVFEQILSTFRSSSAATFIASLDCLAGSFSLKTPIGEVVKNQKLCRSEVKRMATRKKVLYD